MEFFKKTVRVFALCGLFCLAALPLPAQAFFGLFDSHAKVDIRGENVSVDVSGLRPGSAGFYRIEKDGLLIRFFLVRDGQNALHAALDACDVCWRDGKGYKLEGGAMVCVNCGLKFPLAQIGRRRGGCNPHPVSFRTENTLVALRTTELLMGANLFPHNRR
ncbi:MAG: DUF2318 domain-containing protein [Desulfovibrio sp.]|nr:DUF2318 domain-containing protein [Desulfovibrio sp.]